MQILRNVIIYNSNQKTIMGKEYITSFEVQKVTAFTLDEFIEKVKALIKDGTEISNIVAIVVTETTSNP